MRLPQISILITFSIFTSLSMAQSGGDLVVSGATTTNDLAIMALDCTANSNGGALTTDANGNVVCSDDDVMTCNLSECIYPGRATLTCGAMSVTMNCVVPTAPWTARGAAEANSWYSVTYGGGQFVAVSGNGTSRVMTSPDGVSWTARGAAEANSWQSVTYGGGRFVAVSDAGTSRVMTSP